MDPTTILPFPGASHEPLDADLAEIEGRRLAGVRARTPRVRLVGLAHVDDVAAAGLAVAQAAHVAFALERNPNGAAAVTLGPRTSG